MLTNKTVYILKLDKVGSVYSNIRFNYFECFHLGDKI